MILISDVPPDPSKYFPSTLKSIIGSIVSSLISVNVNTFYFVLRSMSSTSSSSLLT